MASRERELVVIDKPNSGHGQTSVEGYRTALAHGAEWILQVDSDGQCDASLLPPFVKASSQHPVTYGFVAFATMAAGAISSRASSA